MLNDGSGQVRQTGVLGGVGAGVQETAGSPQSAKLGRSSGSVNAGYPASAPNGALGAGGATQDEGIAQAWNPEFLRLVCGISALVVAFYHDRLVAMRRCSDAAMLTTDERNCGQRGCLAIKLRYIKPAGLPQRRAATKGPGVLRRRIGPFETDSESWASTVALSCPLLPTAEGQAHAGRLLPLL